jgi:hypothetical protein
MVIKRMKRTGPGEVGEADVALGSLRAVGFRLVDHDAHEVLGGQEGKRPTKVAIRASTCTTWTPASQSTSNVLRHAARVISGGGIVVRLVHRKPSNANLKE